MERVAVPLVEDVPDYEIRAGVMFISVGGKTIMAMPLHAFKAGMAEATRVINAYEGRLAEIHRIEQRRGCSGCDGEPVFERRFQGDTRPKH